MRFASRVRWAYRNVHEWGAEIGWGWVGEGRGILENGPSPVKHGKARKSKPRNLTPPFGGGTRDRRPRTYSGHKKL